MAAAPLIPILLAVGTAISVAGTVVSGVQQKQASDYNAKLAGYQARQAQEAAAVEEQRVREETRRRIGSAQAGFAKGGVTFEGTPLELLSDMQTQGELDALLTRQKGRMAAYGYNAERKLSQMEGNRYMTNSLFSAGSTILSSGYNYFKDDLAGSQATQVS